MAHELGLSVLKIFFFILLFPFLLDPPPPPLFTLPFFHIFLQAAFVDSSSFKVTSQGLEYYNNVK
jgi:hypothetical protein